MTDPVLQWALELSVGYLLAVYGAASVAAAGATVALIRWRRRVPPADDDLLATSRFTIPVSVIVAAGDADEDGADALPAGVQSLLDLGYPELEVIVVCDETSGGALDALRERFDLRACQLFYRRQLPTAPVRLMYRTDRDARVLVVDKTGRGRADALNCAANVARYRYVCLVENASARFTSDCLVRAMRPAMQSPDVVVGVQGEVQIAPRAVGDPTAPADPRSTLLGRFQQMGAFRGHLAGFLRGAVSRPLIATAPQNPGLSLWRRDALIDLGGFSAEPPYETVDLAFRLHDRYVQDGRPYRVVSLQDSVGAAGAARSVAFLVRDRLNRQRAMLDLLWRHGRVFTRSGRGRPDLLGLLQAILAHVAVPVLEPVAIAALVIGAWRGWLPWPDAALAAGTIGLGLAVFTGAAVLVQQSRRGTNLPGTPGLVGLAPLEFFVYRPLIHAARLAGLILFVAGRRPGR